MLREGVKSEKVRRPALVAHIEKLSGIKVKQYIRYKTWHGLLSIVYGVFDCCLLDFPYKNKQ